MHAIVRRFTWRGFVITSFVVAAVWTISQLSFDFDPRDALPALWFYSLISLFPAAVFMLPSFLVADELVARGARPLRSYVIGAVIGAALASAAQWIFRASMHLPILPFPPVDPLHTTLQPAWFFFYYLLYGGLAIAVHAMLRSTRLAADRRRRAEITQVDARRRKLGLELQAMQAHVEPDFLFDTLGHIKTLYESDAVLAGDVLDDLIAYLRAALPRLHEASSTLGREVELTRAYLDIVAVRRGARFNMTFDVDDLTRDLRMPPMVLLPLIDRMLSQSMAPRAGDRTIRVVSRSSKDKLTISIEHRYAGFVPNRDTVDFEDIEERLFALHGDRARLVLESTRTEGGNEVTQATLEIPLETSDRDPR